MRIIDFYSIGAMLINAAVVVCGLYLAWKDKKCRSSQSSLIQGNLYWVLVGLVLIVGISLRFWNLSGLPNGLQQDEASIGYEAYCLSRFGIDRNGYHWPVYPITWGSGGGSPMMIYFNVITTRLFGSAVTSIRMVPAFFGSLTLVLFFGLLLKLWGRTSALMGLFVLSVTPWHIMLSRWSLDSNTAPFFELLAVVLFIHALSTSRTRDFVIAAAASALCLYSYGSANIVIPLYLLLVVIYCLVHRQLTWLQVLWSGIAFFLVLIPLMIFYAVNFLGLPEIALSWISFPRFTSSHFGSVFIPLDAQFLPSLLGNVKGLARILTVGQAGEVAWNMMPGYATLYAFTFPVTFLGIAVSCKRILGRKKGGSESFQKDAVMLGMLFSSALFTLLIEQDVNRSVFLYLPLVYFHVMGLRWLLGGRRVLTWISLALIFVGFLSFSKDYYGGRYNEIASYNFMPGYGDAMAEADRIASERGSHVYSTYEDVASPFMLTLYYTAYDPYEFLDTVKYKDPDAEFRVATSFGHFTFGLPDGDLSDAAYENDVFVLTRSQAAQFQEQTPDGTRAYDLTPFGNFVVIRRSSPAAASGSMDM